MPIGSFRRTTQLAVWMRVKLGPTLPRALTLPRVENGAQLHEAPHSALTTRVDCVRRTPINHGQYGLPKLIPSCLSKASTNLSGIASRRSTENTNPVPGLALCLSSVSATPGSNLSTPVSQRYPRQCRRASAVGWVSVLMPARSVADLRSRRAAASSGVIERSPLRHKGHPCLARASSTPADTGSPSEGSEPRPIDPELPKSASSAFVDTLHALSRSRTPT